MAEAAGRSALRLAATRRRVRVRPGAQARAAVAAGGQAAASAEEATLVIHGLSARAIIGIRPDERLKRQDVLIDVALEVHTRAGRTDRIEDAVDYKAVKDEVLAYVEGSRHGLLEAMAQGIADLCLAQRGVDAAEVTVEKPGALRFARSVSVRIRRERPSRPGRRRAA
jgi:D-erythro-7,8-dihydroneopterin triphosphate epimerase